MFDKVIKMKQFRVVCGFNDGLKSDWFYCKDFTIETMQHLATRFNKYGEWHLEYKEV